MKEKLFESLQRLGKTFMLPISILPLAGLFLGISASFTGETFVKMYHLENILSPGMPLHSILSVLGDCGAVVFDNLGLLFAISIALGLAKSEKGVAALSAVVGYFMMYASLSSSIIHLRGLEELEKIPGLITSLLGFEHTMNLGVFGGIIIGCLVAWLHNRYYKIELPDALSFFAGTHFVPIVSAVAGVVSGLILSFIWPYFAAGIANLGQIIANTGHLGTFLYGYIYRALIPFGLHHIFYLPFWQTAVGGTAVVDGTTVVGAQNIIFAQLKAGEAISPDAARFFAFQFPEMIFALPAAAYAMYRAARSDKKTMVKGLLFSASLTSIVTGITEPIEFTILFASPLLYFGVHCVLFALSTVLVHIAGVGVGLTFSGGLIDFILYGVLPGNARTHWIPVVIIGIIYAIVYFFLFHWIIKKFDLDTPGRKADTSLHTKEEFRNKNALNGLSETDQRAYQIVSGLGGTDNLVDVDNCATRLRVTVKNGDEVNKEALQATGAAGVVVRGNSVQVIYGTTVSTIKTQVTEFIDSGQAPKTAATVVNEKQAEDLKGSAQVVSDQAILDGIPVELYAVADGEVISIDKVEDEVFSQKMMGDGYAIQPSQGQVVAPVNGKILNIFPTKHALGIQSDEGLEILVHMGLDTVELKGEGFTIQVEEGQSVKAGEPLAQMDLASIEAKAKACDIMVVLTNSDRVHSLDVLDQKQVTAGEKVGEALLNKE